MKTTSPLKACIYVRVSTDRQAKNELSLTDQIAQTKRWCLQNDAVVVGEICEPGASATDDARKQFQQMMMRAMSDERPYDLIVVHSLSRLFRNVTDFMAYRAKLKARRVKIVSITQDFGDDPAAELAIGLIAMFDEYQSKENAKHVRRAMLENAKLGFWNGQTPPLGYRTYGATRIGGKIKKKLEIEEDEAFLVRKIFDLYLLGPAGSGPLGITRLAAWLNEHGYKTRGRIFTVSNVQAVLRNSAYIGIAVYNKRDSNSREVRPESEWIPIPVPPIISGDSFEAVHTKLSASRVINTPARVTTTNNLLIGIATCGCGSEGCGGGMTAATGKSGAYRYYSCSTRMRAGASVCAGRRIQRDALDEIVLGAVEKRLLATDRLEELLAGWLDKSEDAVAGRREALRQLRTQQTNYEARIDRLLDVVLEGKMSASNDRFSKKMRAEQQQLENVKTDIAMLERQVAGSIRKITPGVVERFAALMKQKLRESDPSLRQFYIRTIVDRVEVGSEEIRISGKVRALERAVSASTGDNAQKVRSIEREWCAREDSNLRPPD